MRRAYGHKLAVMHCGQCLLTWINAALVSSWSSLMQHSVTPFWWWALTPAYVILWLSILQLLTQAFAQNTPLSA
jgi:hypothetical protein